MNTREGGVGSSCPRFFGYRLAVALFQCGSVIRIGGRVVVDGDDLPSFDANMPKSYHTTNVQIGNSLSVGRKHCLRITGEMGDCGPGLHAAVQNRVRQAAVKGRTRSQARTLADGEISQVRSDAATCEDFQVAGLGLEPRTHGLKGRCSAN